MRYHFKVHKEKEGFWAECIELQGCVTQGDTKEELDANMKEALNLYLDENDNFEYLAPLPKTSIKAGHNVVEVPVDPSIALAFSIRKQKLKQGLMQVGSCN